MFLKLASNQPFDLDLFKIRASVSKKPVEEKEISAAGMFVLLTTAKDGRNLSDCKILETYKGQSVVEVGFHWLKGPLAVAPVFLKSPKRIDVLGFIYMVALLIYGLIQRDIRMKLEKRGGKIACPDNRRTDRPTTQGILKVFENIDCLIIPSPGTEIMILRYFTKEHQEILDLLGISNLYSENLSGFS